MDGTLFAGDPSRPEDAEADGALSDAARFGLELPAEALALPDHVGVWPENAAIVEAFLLMSSQWRMRPGQDGVPRLIGLDYAGARAGLEMLGTEITTELWQGVMIVEAGAKAAWNERLT